MEHVIRLLKIFRIVGTVNRHDRSEDGKIVYLCVNICAHVEPNCYLTSRVKLSTVLLNGHVCI